MNYSTPDSDKQFNSNGLVPELPFLTQVPKVLKPYDNWVCWQYHKSGESLLRIPVKPQAKLEDAYKLCQSEGYGLGFLLTPENPIAAICIAGYKDKYGQLLPDTQDILKISKTYTEVDERVGELYVVGFADGEWNVGKDRIRIVSDEFVVPITVDTIGAFSNVSDCQQAFATVARRYCSLSWMEKFETMRESCDEFTSLSRVLTECLDTQGWLDNAENTDLYEFLGLCWHSPEMRQKVNLRMQSEKRSFRVIDDLDKIARSCMPKQERKTRRATAEDVDILDFDDDLPVIEHDRSYPTTSTDETIDALIKFNAPIWQRDGTLVTIQSASRDPSSPNPSERKKIRVINLDPDYLQELSTQAAHHLVDYRHYKGKTFYRYDTCPMSTVKRILARPDHDPFPHLSGVVTIPTLRRDGSIITKPGYDPETTLYYKPSREFPDPRQNPTIDDAIDALQSLREPMADFHFPKGYFESAALAAILTVMSRHILQNVPATPISSSTRGIGKGLLFSIITIIGTGEKIAPIPYPKNEEEMAKQFLSIGMEGARIVLFDNITRPLGGETIELALTSDFFKNRILSTNTMSEIKMGTTFFATGNNMRFTGDMLRRSIPIILESEVESPEQRSDFKIKRLKDWLIKNQPRLAIDALTILQAFMGAGQPDQELSEYGSFEEWSDLVRSALVWLDLEDPYLAQKSMENMSDTSYEQLKTLIDTWDKAIPGGKGNKRQLSQILFSVKDPQNAASETMRDFGLALTAYDPGCKGNISALNINRLGQKLPLNDGKSRIIDGKCIMSETGARNSGKLYWIASAEESRRHEDDDDVPF